MFIKQNFYIIKLRKNFFSFIFVFFTLGLLFFSSNNISAIKSGLTLWANSVVPSLFPFFVSTELLMHTNIVSLLGKIFNKFMKPIFNIRGEGSFAFIMGIISGYPIGAKIATNFRKNNICTKEECERLLSFTNNSGPLFIIGTVGILMFKSSTIGILLFITHILACITVGFIFRFWKCNKKNSQDIVSNHIINNQKKVCFASLGEVISNSINSAISTTLLIGRIYSTFF